MRHSAIMNVWSVYRCSLVYSHANLSYMSWVLRLSVIQHSIRSLSALSKRATQR